MSADTKLYVKVCEKCGRQVNPHVDHNLGASRFVYCSHGKLGPGTSEQVGWKRIEVIPAPSPEARALIASQVAEGIDEEDVVALVPVWNEAREAFPEALIPERAEDGLIHIGGAG